MRIGICSAPLGAFTNPVDIATLATEAEHRGYHEIWAIDRLLNPVTPQSPYPASADGQLPDTQRVSLDPIVALATAAAVTQRIRIGTNVLVAPWYRPALLARSLASLDAISGGRLDIGLGLGWSADEYQAVGVPQRDLAARQVDLLDALDTLWRPGPRSYRGRDYLVATSDMEPKPHQRPRPPILLAAYTEAGLRRAGRRADGWTPSGLDLPTTAAMWSIVRDAAARAGRDPDQLSLVIHAGVHDSPSDLGASRRTFCGSVGQIADDLNGARELGADQVVLYPHLVRSHRELFDVTDRIVEAAELQPAAIR